LEGRALRCPSCGFASRTTQYTLRRSCSHRAPPRSSNQEAILRLSLVFGTTTTLCLLLACPSLGVTPKQYAMTLASGKYGWTGSQHRALDAIVSGESGWDPCRRYPGTTQCGYSGSNSCGIPQASPCPAAWRGRLAGTWRAQVEWLLSYIDRRYHDPLSALAFRRSHNWY